MNAAAPLGPPSLAAFVLPPLAAFAGDRVNRLVFGKDYTAMFGAGARFAIGLAVAMLLFSQAILFAALAGFNLAAPLAWGVFIWGAVEVVLLVPQALQGLKGFKPQLSYFWFLLLLPILYAWWVFGQLSILEGTLEFDAAAFWVFKAKIMYLVQGKAFLDCIHDPSLAYAHWDYPMLVPGLYTLGYGLMGHVDEFVNKVWPFWMDVALVMGILSLGNFWKRPHPLTAGMALVFSFLPTTLQYTRQEGGTLPMVFYTGLAALLIIKALSQDQALSLFVAVPVLAGCACTKFEGVVYAGIWFCLLVPICLRRLWQKKAELWKAIPLAAIALVPYAWFRISKPIPHPESDWWKSFAAAPPTALHRLPQVWFLSVFSRFFSADFFKWAAGDHKNLVWAGKSSGWTDFVNADLTVLPWLVLALLALALLKRTNRLAVTAQALASLGFCTVLSLVIASLPRMEADLSQAIEFSTDVVGRYYFPMFMAWFLGLASLWFAEPTPAAIEPSKPAPRPKKR